MRNTRCVRSISPIRVDTEKRISIRKLSYLRLRAYMSILLQPIWFDLRPYIRVERDGRERIIQVMTPSDPIVRSRLLATTMPCISCGKRINPITANNGGALLGGLTYSATC